MTPILCLLLAAGIPATQAERKPVASREFTLKIHAPERPTIHVLWMSRDGGNAWTTASGAQWDAWAAGVIRCTVRVPEDGDYDFYAQLGDDLSNQNAAPKPGQAARPDMRFTVRDDQGGIRFLSPRSGGEFIGGNQVILRWAAEAEDLKKGSVHLYAQIDGKPWEVVASDLALRDKYTWTLPAAGREMAIRFRVEAFRMDGRKVSGRDVEGMIVPGRTTAGLAWEEPSAPGDWTGGQQVTLRWSASGPEFRERSARLQYELDASGPWITITKGLEPTGTYVWVVPNRETASLRLRVSAITRGGREATGTSVAMSVRKTGRADVARARKLYDRARVLHAQARYTEAQLKYREALEAWSEFGEVFNDLGKLHVEQRQPAKALEYFLRARKVCPSNPIPYVNAAFVEVRLGLVDDAMAELRDALDLGLEKSERTSVLAGEILWRIARQAEKLDDAPRAREAAGLLLKIRRAAPATRTRAEKMLLRLHEGALAAPDR